MILKLLSFLPMFHQEAKIGKAKAQAKETASENYREADTFWEAIDRVINQRIAKVEYGRVDLYRMRDGKYRYMDVSFDDVRFNLELEKYNAKTEKQKIEVAWKTYYQNLSEWCIQDDKEYREYDEYTGEIIREYSFWKYNYPSMDFNLMITEIENGKRVSSKTYTKPFSEVRPKYDWRSKNRKRLIHQKTDKLKDEFGSFVKDGVEYVIVEKPVAKKLGFAKNSRTMFSAGAINPDDRDDDRGHLPVYNVSWMAKEKWEKGDRKDEKSACNWKKPDDMQLAKGRAYIISTGKVL